MSNSRINLVLGLVWFPLWGYHALARLWPRGWIGDALVEMLLLFPLGIVWVADGLRFWSTPRNNYLTLQGLSWMDALTYAAGAGGLLVILLGVLGCCLQDPDMGWVGFIVAAMAGLHLYRRWPYYRLYNSGSQGL